MSIMLILAITCVFHSFITKGVVNLLANRFNVVSKYNNLIVHFIDVGQADAIAINLPDGKIMLIDNGGKYTNVTYVNYLKDRVLNTKKNKTIDYLVLTHADSDHVAGTMKLLNSFDIKLVFMPRVGSDSQTYQEIFEYVNKNCKFKTLGTEFLIKSENYKFTFFEQLNVSNTNDSSQVIKLEYLNKSFLFTGDISTSVEDDYVSVYSDRLNCDVLKVAHHGSKSSTSQLFLNYTTPQYAVLSVGLNNDYNHPNDEIIQRLKSNNIDIVRTDKSGNIMFVVGENYNLNVVTGTAFVISLTLDYRIYVVCINACLMVVAIIITIKKDKTKNKHISIDLIN